VPPNSVKLKMCSLHAREALELLAGALHNTVGNDSDVDYASWHRHHREPHWHNCVAHLRIMLMLGGCSCTRRHRRWAMRSKCEGDVPRI